MSKGFLRSGLVCAEKMSPTVVNSLPWTGEGPYSGQVFVDAIGAGIAQAGCPVAYVNQVLAPITDRTRDVLAAGGVPYAIPGLRQAVVAGLVYSLLLAAISLIFIELIVHLGLAPGLDAFLAFLPGGQAEMIVIAIIAGADLAYVVSHHLLRIVLVILLAPIVARLFR